MSKGAEAVDKAKARATEIRDIKARVAALVGEFPEQALSVLRRWIKEGKHYGSS